MMGFGLAWKLAFISATVVAFLYSGMVDKRWRRAGISEFLSSVERPAMNATDKVLLITS